MKIKSINITSFGGIKNISLDLSENINIIYGKNGSGKSTIMNFIKLMLYSKTENERSSDISKNLRKRTKPLDGSVQQGSITIFHNNCDYLIEKKFGKTAGSDETQITNLNTGENISLGPGVEPGEYFTGLSLSQFERCYYILSSDYANLETELTDIKDFSSSEEETMGSVLSSSFAELNKIKERYISKSKKKGIIVEKEFELNRVLSDISNSLESEKIAEDLDNEFNGVKKRIEDLENDLKTFENAQSKKLRLKSLTKLLELKKDIENINIKISNWGFNVNTLKEYLSLGDILLQNTLARFRMYEESKSRVNDLCFEKISASREKALKLTENINYDSSRKDYLTLLLDKKDNYRKKIIKKRKYICLTTFLLIVNVFLLILTLKNFFIGMPYIFGLSILINIFLFFKLTKAFKDTSLSKLELTDDELSISIDDITENIIQADERINLYKEELENVFLENNLDNIDELTEKYYAIKSSFEHSDCETLKNTALESSRRFILHVNKILETGSFEDAKDNFENIKTLLSRADMLKKEYSGLLEITAINDKKTLEFEKEIDEINEFIAQNKIISFDEKFIVEKEINLLKEKLLNLKSKYPKVSKSVYELRHEEESIKNELSELNDTYSAILLAEQLLKESYNEVSYGFIPKLNQIASSVLSKLEGSENKELIICENVTPKVKKDLTGDFVHSSFMSESEKERIFLALRLAIILTVEDENSKFPIIADDIFSTYDSISKERAISFLKEFSKDRQIIFFTCHESVKNVFDKGDSVKNLEL